MTLDEEDVDAIARRVVEVMKTEAVEEAGGLVDAATLAGQLGLSRDYVYRHARELGGEQIGDGARPRWRFNPALARLGREPRSSAVSRPAVRVRRRSTVADVSLLPVLGGRP